MKDINFIKPISPKKQEEIIRWFKISLVGSCGLMIVLSFFTVYQVYHLILLKQKKQALQSNSVQLERAKEKRSQLEKMQDSLQEKIKKIELFTTSPKQTKQLLQQLSTLIPQDVVLLQYKQTNDSLELEGLAFKTNSILNFLQALNQSEYFGHMHIHSMQQDAKNSDGHSLIRFVIKGKIFP